MRDRPAAALRAAWSGRWSGNRSPAVTAGESPAPQAAPDRTARPKRVADHLPRPRHAVLPSGRTPDLPVGAERPVRVRDAVIVRPVLNPSAVVAGLLALPRIELRMRVVVVLMDQVDERGRIDERNTGRDRLPQQPVVV